MSELPTASSFGVQTQKQRDKHPPAATVRLQFVNVSHLSRSLAQVDDCISSSPLLCHLICRFSLFLSPVCLSPCLYFSPVFLFPCPPPPFSLSIGFSLCVLLLQGHDDAAACAVLKSVDSFSFLQHPVHQRSLEILQRCKEEKHSKAACTTLTSHSATRGSRKGRG